MRCYSCNAELRLFGRENCVLTVNNEDFAFGSFECLRRSVEGILSRAEGRHAESARHVIPPLQGAADRGGEG